MNRWEWKQVPLVNIKQQVVHNYIDEYLQSMSGKKRKMKRQLRLIEKHISANWIFGQRLWIQSKKRKWKKDSTHKRKFATNARKFFLSCVSLCSFWSAFVSIQCNNNDVLMHSYAMSNEYMFIDKCFKISIFSTIFSFSIHIYW